MPPAAMKAKAAYNVRRIFHAPDNHPSQTLLKVIATQYGKTTSRLCSPSGNLQREGLWAIPSPLLTTKLNLLIHFILSIYRKTFTLPYKEQEFFILIV